MSPFAEQHSLTSAARLLASREVFLGVQSANSCPYRAPVLPALLLQVIIISRILVLGRWSSRSGGCRRGLAQGAHKAPDLLH